MNEDEKLGFINSLDFILVPKRTMLLRAGEICRFEAFIHKGCARIYYINEEGVDVTLFFVEEGGWLSDMVSFYDKKPSTFFIETLEDTEMYGFCFESKEKLLAEMPKFERIFLHLILQNLAGIQLRLVKMITDSAADQYLEFLKLYPSITLRIPQYLIASYLGVTPAFLSVIKRKLSKRKVGAHYL
ncbi:Crp/Fnr family transcriptional regulator [Sphingobacterium sp. SYP-B4668]|uniref:Crp/Fnr family transcriptional regulator n=1 Tax=Sphingobacterium sp. SYP-B4668 TaxID=2996035 RepID=UPI0022DE0031|nr:Crp/Fnr family transcriptional regulator [Sphingobacterium sp. SYP-B4668]